MSLEKWPRPTFKRSGISARVKSSATTSDSGHTFLEGSRGGPETSALELLTTCPGALNPQGGQKRSEHPLEDSGSPAAAEKMSSFHHDQRACFRVDLKAQIPVAESHGDREGVFRPGAHTHTHTHSMGHSAHLPSLGSWALFTSG